MRAPKAALRRPPLRGAAENLGAAQRFLVSRGGSLWGTVKAVGWSFVGLRKRSDLESDGAKLNPVHIIVAGFAGVFVFVVGLIALVNWVAAK